MVFQNILIIGQFKNCFIAARGKAKLKQPAYRSNEFQFFQQGVGSSFFSIDISETSLKLLKSLQFR